MDGGLRKEDVKGPERIVRSDRNFNSAYNF
jgi:hypothetical protein